MALNFKAVIEALLPDGALWTPVADGDFDKLLAGIGINFEELYQFLKDLANIRNPYETPWLEDLEKEYGIVTNLVITELRRREQLAEKVYNKTGTGSIDDLQEALDKAGFDLNVLPNDPAVDPKAVLAAGYQTQAGGANAYAGFTNDPVPLVDVEAVAGFAGGYALVVNGDQFDQSIDYIMVAGGAIAYAGFTNDPVPLVDVEAVAGHYIGLTKIPTVYNPPDAWERWRYLFYVGNAQLGWPLQSALLRTLVYNKTCLFYNDYFCPFEEKKAGFIPGTSDPLLEKYTDFSNYHNHAHNVFDVAQSRTGIIFSSSNSALGVYGADDLADLKEMTIVALADYQSHPSVGQPDETIANKATPIVMHFRLNLEYGGGARRIEFHDTVGVHRISRNMIGNRYLGVNAKDGFVPECFINGITAGPMGVGLAVLPVTYDFDMVIGNDVATVNTPFLSEMQALLIFNRQLTADEHLQLYNDLLLLQYPEVTKGLVESERIEVLKRIILQYKPLGRWCGLFVDPT